MSAAPVIVTETEFTRRLFEVIASLTPEEKAEWHESLIAWANEKEEAAP